MITLKDLSSVSTQKDIWIFILNVMEGRYPRYQRLIDLARQELKLINPSAFIAESLESVPVIFFPFAGEDTEQVCMFYIQALTIVMGCSYLHRNRFMKSTRDLELTLPVTIDGVSPVVAVNITSVIETALDSNDVENTLEQSPGLEIVASLLVSRDLFYTVFDKHGLRLPGVRLESSVLGLWLLRGKIVIDFF